MSPVEFKKMLCRPVEFKGQWGLRGERELTGPPAETTRGLGYGHAKSSLRQIIS